MAGNRGNLRTIQMSLLSPDNGRNLAHSANWTVLFKKFGIKLLRNVKAIDCILAGARTLPLQNWPICSNPFNCVGSACLFWRWYARGKPGSLKLDNAQVSELLSFPWYSQSLSGLRILLLNRLAPTSDRWRWSANSLRLPASVFIVVGGSLSITNHGSPIQTMLESRDGRPPFDAS